MSAGLTEVQQVFLQRRQSKKKPGRISNRLKQMALGLLNEHSLETVSQALGISSKLLEDWQYLELKPEFVSLKIPSSLTATSDGDPLSFEVLLPEGVKLNLKVDPMNPFEHLSIILKTLRTCYR